MVAVPHVHARQEPVTQEVSPGPLHTCTPVAPSHVAAHACVPLRSPVMFTQQRLVPLQDPSGPQETTNPAQGCDIWSDTHVESSSVLVWQHSSFAAHPFAQPMPVLASICRRPLLDPDPEPDPDPELDVDPELDPELAPELECEDDVDPDPEPDVDPEAEVEPDVDPEAAVELDVDPEAEVEPDADPELDPVDVLEPELAPEPDPESPESAPSTRSGRPLSLCFASARSPAAPSDPPSAIVPAEKSPMSPMPTIARHAVSPPVASNAAPASRNQDTPLMSPGSR